MKRQRIERRLLAPLASLSLCAGVAHAQTAPAAPPPAVAYSAPVSTAPLPDELTRARLIWSTMIAIEQANESGNYSVLRDISAPSFQMANDPSRLSGIFAGIRATHIDLSNTLVLAPTYRQPPVIDNGGMMHLNGAFGLRPTAVLFDLTFQWVTNRWMLFGVSLGARTITSGFDTAAPAQATQPAPARRK